MLCVHTFFVLGRQMDLDLDSRASCSSRDGGEQARLTDHQCSTYLIMPWIQWLCVLCLCLVWLCWYRRCMEFGIHSRRPLCHAIACRLYV
jgi:hypothetical protein